jgi:uncharacterized protein YbgA (DUF1722 family)/uncharacterized protein YbbK (DUF523 family)
MENIFMEKIKLGISTCLLGEKVRFDGGHKWDHFLTDTLGQYVEYVPVCPEVECGYGIPREPFRLVGESQSPHLVTFRTNHDHTERMIQWTKRKVMELKRENLCGFIFKSGSPSSGMERVKVYDQNGIPSRNGVGIFARVFMEHFPLLPVEDEGRLNDPKIRENFIERIFTLQRWSGAGEGMGNLISFHTRHKLLILSHSPKHYQMMGRLVAWAKEIPWKDMHKEYERLLLEALSLKTTAKKNANVLQHVMGYFKGQLSADEKKELREIIDLYRQGMVPLIVPITLLNHYVRKYDQPYLKDQVYLHPHPVDLQLRNHV